MIRRKQCSSKEKALQVLEDTWQESGSVCEFVGIGVSMGDTYPTGTKVFIRFGKHLELRRGLVVYFRRHEKRIVHRLVAVLGWFCIEKGDGSRTPKLILRRQVLGICESFLIPPETSASNRLNGESLEHEIIP